MVCTAAAAALLGLVGCGIDNNIVPKDDNSAVITDSGDTAPQVDTAGLVDTADTATETDTGLPCSTQPVADTFDQEIPKVMDVLFVVDNSGSMSDEQRALADNFPLFLDWFQASSVDYHIGVVTTDMDDASDQGKLREVDGYRYIDTSISDAYADAIFKEMAKPGISGSSNERGLDAIYAAMVTQQSYNAGFLRADADGLHIIVVSDEDDASTILQEPMADWLIEQGRQRGQISSSSIVLYTPDCSYNAGAEYLYLTEHVGGLKYPICLADWSASLNDLGDQIVRLKKEFMLTSSPWSGVFLVRVTESSGYAYDVPSADYAYNAERNSIIFNDDKIPAESSTIVVSYDTEVCP